ncbi:unnamed protein product, partial [Brassica oleracea]
SNTTPTYVASNHSTTTFVSVSTTQPQTLTHSLSESETELKSQLSGESGKQTEAHRSKKTRR